MEITPQDVQQKQFDQVKRGFDPQQVGVFLDQVAATLAKRDHTIADAYAKIEKLGSAGNESSENQDAFRLTMTVATETMEEMLRMAGQRAAEIEEEARAAAELLVERARVDAEDKVASVKRDLASLETEKARPQSQSAAAGDDAAEPTADSGQQPTARRPLELVVDRLEGEQSDDGDQDGTGSGLAARVGDLRG